MSFFSTTPRFNSAGIVRDGIVVNTSPSLIATDMVGPGAYNCRTKETILERTSHKYGSLKIAFDTQAGNKNHISPSRSVRSSLNQSSTTRQPPRTPTGTFGASQRTSPLNRDFVKGGVMFRGSRIEAQNSLGPGSYTDSHYKGSPTVVASTMLHNSFNVRINGGGKKAGQATLNTSGRKEGYEGSSFSPRASAGEGRHIMPLSSRKKKGNIATGRENLFSSPHVSRAHDRDFVTQQTRLNASKQ